MRALELFAGNKSFGKVAKEWHNELCPGFVEIVSLDFLAKFNSTITADILAWDYKAAYPPGYFDFVWASPDCTSWSIATHKHRTKGDMSPKTDKARIGEALIHKTWEILDYFQPRFYAIENPRGRLAYFPPMARAPFRTLVYYSHYGNPNSKPTHIWTNFPLWLDEKREKGAKQNILWATIPHRLRSLIPAPLIARILEAMAAAFIVCPSLEMEREPLPQLSD
jgi:hypothetical protein